MTDVGPEIEFLAASDGPADVEGRAACTVANGVERGLANVGIEEIVPGEQVVQRQCRRTLQLARALAPTRKPDIGRSVLLFLKRALTLLLTQQLLRRRLLGDGRRAKRNRQSNGKRQLAGTKAFHSSRIPAFLDTARRRLLPAATVSLIDFSGFRDYSNHRGVIAVRACVAKRGAS